MLKYVGTIKQYILNLFHTGHMINICSEVGLILSFVYFFVGWHARAISSPPNDVIFAQPSCPLNYIILCLHQEQQTHLSTIIAHGAISIILPKFSMAQSCKTFDICNLPIFGISSSQEYPWQAFSG
jgi:hypothetical protein